MFVKLCHGWLCGLILVGLLAPFAAAQGQEKVFDEGISNQVKKGVAAGLSFEEILPTLQAKDWLEPGPRGERNLRLAETIYHALTKNPAGLPRRGAGPVAPRVERRRPFVDVGESEPNDDPGTADDIVLGETGRGTIDPEGDVDWWRFEIGEATGVVASCLTPDSSLDPQLTLFDAAQRELAFDDDDGPALDSRLVTYLPPGTYYLKVEAYAGASTGSYELVTSGAGAIPIMPRDLVDGVIEGSGEVLFYVFDSPEETDVDLRSQTLGSGLDSKLRLSDATGQVLGEDDDGGPGNDAWLQGSVPAGSFVVSVDSFDGQGTGTFFMQSLCNPAAAPTGAESEPNDDFTGADAASCCDVLSGAIDPSHDADFFFLHLASDTGLTLAVDTPQSDLDPKIVLYDSQHSEIGQDDDGGPGTDARLQARLVAGDYFASVIGYGSSIGSYQLTVTCGGYFVPITSESEPNDDFTSAGSFSPGEDLAGAIDSVGDRDYFILEAKTPLDIDILVRSNGSDLDSQLHLYDADLQEIYFDDDGGAGLDSALRGLVLAEGIYFVEVNGFGTTTGAYELIADSAFVRPGIVSAGERTILFLRARNADRFFILVGTTENRIETRFGNQLVAPAQFVLISVIPPCGTLAVDVDVPPELSGQFFLSQSLTGNIPYGGALFTNLLQADIQ